MSKEGQFLPKGFTATATSLSVDPQIAEKDFMAGCSIVSRLAIVAEESLPYWIGDLINAGEQYFPNRYEQAIEITGYVRGTLANYAWMCRHVPQENRGIAPIQHTLAVTPRPADEQRKLLHRASEESLTATEFRRLLKGDPAYKRKALPDMVGTKKERLMATWEETWQTNEREWLNEETAKRMCRKAYAQGIEDAMAVSR